MKIGELARVSKISPRMLRYYEQEKLLTPIRTESGYREYHQSDIDQVKLIHRLNSAGLTLKTIRQILPCWHADKRNFVLCETYKQNMKETLGKIEQQISMLEQTRQRLVKLLSLSN